MELAERTGWKPALLSSGACRKRKELVKKEGGHLAALFLFWKGFALPPAAVVAAAISATVATVAVRPSATVAAAAVTTATTAAAGSRLCLVDGEGAAVHFLLVVI